MFYQDITKDIKTLPDGTTETTETIIIVFPVPDVPSPRQQKKKSEIRTLLDATTTVADNQKPQWMIFQCHGGPNTLAAGGLDNAAYEQEELKLENSTVLPWKREDQEVQVTSMADQQIPAWIKNQDYIASYSSPSNTLLGLPRDEKKRSAIIGYFQKRDSLTFLGDFENVDSKNGSRRNSKDGDFLSVLANPVNIRKSSAPPLNRQISLSSMRVRSTFLYQDSAMFY